MNHSVTQLLTKNKHYITVLFIGLICLTACKKEETDDTLYSDLSIYNGSPTAATYDIYVDGAQLNAVPVPLGGSIAYGKHTLGNHTVKFSVAGRTETAHSKQINLSEATYYSVFLVGKPGAFDSFIVTDDLSGRSTTQAFVRLVNVSPDATALDLYDKSGKSLITGQGYKMASKFVAIDPGAQTFDIKAGTATVTSTTSTTLLAGYKYTIFVRGLVNPVASEDLGLGAQVIQIK